MRKTIAERADDSVRWTGIPQFAEATSAGRQPRFRLRWLPLATLGAATLGMGLIVARRDLYWLGYAALMLGFAVGNMLPIFGPVKPWGMLHGVDERDRKVRRDAYFATFATISVAAVLGLFGLAWMTLSAAWDVERLGRVLLSFTFYLIALWSSLPTLHASWAVRPLPDE